MEKFKIAGVGIGVLGWLVVGYLISRPAPEPIIVNKVVTVDRIVTQNVHKVKTKVLPNGTKITETTETVKNTAVREQSRTVASVLHEKPKYSLGISLKLDPMQPLKREYQLELGRRLWETPLWLRGAVSTDKTITLGLSLEF